MTAATPQTLPLDIQSFDYSSSSLHPALLSFIELQKHYQKLIPDEPFNSTETNNNSLPSLQISTTSCSSRSDSDSTSSPTFSRKNVIVKNDAKRRKELVKDDAYWERRKKNNDAAKRSRDSRRMKEDEMASRAACLEKDNMILRRELEKLRKETESLRTLLLSTTVSSNIKVPVPLRHIPAIPTPTSVITQNTGHIPFPDSTLRNSVLVPNYLCAS